MTPEEAKEAIKEAFKDHLNRSQALDALETKKAVKEAFKEYLDQKASEFGWFSFRWIGYSLLGAVFIFILVSSGWHR